MSMTVLDRDEIEQSLALLETADAPDPNVKAAAQKLRRALRDAEMHHLLTTSEAADALGVRSINTVKRWVKTGYIQGVQRNERMMIPTSEVVRIHDDDRVRAQRALSTMQQELADIGSPEDLTEGELAGLRAGRPRQLPWQR